MLGARSMKVARVLGATIIVGFALATAGNLVPALPLLSVLGPILLPRMGAWIVLFSLAATVLYVRRWLNRRRRGALLLAALACFAGLGTAGIQARQIARACAENVRVDLAQTLWFGSSPKNDTPPQNFTYDSIEGRSLALDVYRPAPIRDGARAPVLVYFHGGGWVAGSRKQRQADLRWFVDQGFVVVSMDYSLSSAQTHLWNIVQPQLGCGLAWIVNNADKIGADLSRLVLFGESAGGNLVLNVSYMGNQGSLRPSCAGALPHVAATIAPYPVVDAALAYHNPDLTLGRFAKSMAVDYTGGSPTEFADRYAYIASSTHINSAAPPTLLIAPEGDTLVDPEGAYAFAAQAAKAGVDVHLIRVPFAQHGFDLTQGSIGNQLVRQATLLFLDKHGLKP